MTRRRGVAPTMLEAMLREAQCPRFKGDARRIRILHRCGQLLMVSWIIPPLCTYDGVYALPAGWSRGRTALSFVFVAGYTYLRFDTDIYQSCWDETMQLRALKKTSYVWESLGLSS